MCHSAQDGPGVDYDALHCLTRVFIHSQSLGLDAQPETGNPDPMGVGNGSLGGDM
jgi:hypothetical protein